MNVPVTHIVKNLEEIYQLPFDVAIIEGVDLGDSEVLALTAFHQLNELNLGGCEEITDKSISQLHRLPNLQKIDLSLCNQTTDISLFTLSLLPRLHFLNLSWCYSVTDNGLKRLGQCKSLESILLWSCEEITDEGVEALAVLPKLRILELPVFAHITDRAIFALSQNATRLEALRLDHLEEISDEGIVSLSRLSGLRKLLVEACPKVTPEAISVLQEDLPECEIIFQICV